MSPPEPLSAGIRETLQALDKDADVRCLVVRGAGERAFCAGTDLNSLGVLADAWAWRHSVNYALEFGAFRKPVVAALKGWVFGGGFSQRLTRLVGYGQASRILLTGDPIPAEEADRIGAVELLAEDGQEDEQARKLAKRIAAHSEVATVTNKAGTRAALEGGLTDGLAMKRELMCLSFALGAQRSGPELFDSRERR